MVALIGYICQFFLAIGLPIITDDKGQINKHSCTNDDTVQIRFSEEEPSQTILNNNEVFNISSNLANVENAFENSVSSTQLDCFSDELCVTNFNLDSNIHGVSSQFSKSNITNDLRKWALENNINHSQFHNLLLTLRHYHPELPKDSRTLLCTKRNLSLKTMKSSRGSEGKFKYFGIQHGLEIEFKKGYYSFLKDNNKQLVIEIILNVDGIPIYKSSSTQFWPICGKIYSTEIHTDVFDIAIYVGDSKPQSIEEYMSDFVAEINVLQNYGFFYNHEKCFVKLKAFSCDSPARAFLKCIKSHNSQEGCEFCNTQGERMNNRIIYPCNQKDIEFRTDRSFRAQSHKNHHTGISPLVSVQNFDIVNGFVLDYMHMACLGTMRRLINRWLKTDSGFCIRPSFRKLASERMCMIELPKDFNRKMRSFTELDRFKATEYSILLLYVAPFIFKDLIPSEQFNHFLCLYCAMRICCSKTLLNEHGHKAISLIEEFVNKSQNIYCGDEPVYNTHSIQHMIQNAVKSKVTLEEINCFPFENHLGQLKKLVRGNHLPLEQVVKRLLERGCCLKKYDFKSKNIFIVPQSKSDRYVFLKNNKIMVVHSITQNGNKYKGQIYQTVADVFSNPIQSRIIKVWQVTNLSTHLFEVPIEDCLDKCILIQQNRQHFMLALLN